MGNNKILIVDDEINIIDLLSINLKARGHNVLTCLTGEEAIRICEIEKPDLILLDLMLPGIDGLQVCRILKEKKETADIPIIMLTAKVEERDKIIGLELGADDYITKPFSVMELITRVNVALRRVERYNGDHTKKNNIIQIKDLIIDCNRFVVTKSNEVIELTIKEFNLLRILAQNHQMVLTREQLHHDISGEKTTSELRSIDVHMTNLRKKLGKYNEQEDYIETIRGVGYKMA